MELRQFWYSWMDANGIIELEVVLLSIKGGFGREYHRHGT